jgi:hypothetical protein
MLQWQPREPQRAAWHLETAASSGAAGGFQKAGFRTRVPAGRSSPVSPQRAIDLGLKQRQQDEIAHVGVPEYAQPLLKQRGVVRPVGGR